MKKHMQELYGVAHGQLTISIFLQVQEISLSKFGEKQKKNLLK